MGRLTALLFVVGFVFFNSWASGGGVGATFGCQSSHCWISAASSPASIVLAFLLTFMLPFYPLQAKALDDSRVVGMWRRLCAVILDFMIVMTVVSPLAALPMLISEAKQSGVFRWSFAREVSSTSDSIFLLLAGFFAFFVLFAYFYQHPRLGRQTLGQFILGISVTWARGSRHRPQYAKRVLLAFIGFCIWPMSVVLAVRNPRREFWWDAATNSSVVRVASARQAS